MNKGDYGYMNQYKKKHCIAVLIYAFLILVLVLATLFVEYKAVILLCYISAILLVLPGAKHLVAVIVVIDYHTLDSQSIEDLDEHTRDKKFGITIYDVTLASEDVIMYSPYIYLVEGKLYCLMINVTSKISTDMVKQYLNKILKNAGFPMEIIMVHNISEMNKILEEINYSEETNMEFLEKVKKHILIYNV